MDYNQITKAHLAIREARSQMRKEYDAKDAELQEQQRKLENVMLKQLLDSGVDSMRTASGTFYRQEKMKASASDWQALYDWIKDNDAFDALERRIKTAFVKEHMEEHDGTPPPGVSVHREYEVRVR